jgi:hypothetical protein
MPYSIDDGIELSEDYDSEDPKGVQEFISKKIGLPITVKSVSSPGDEFDDSANEWLGSEK